MLDSRALTPGSQQFTFEVKVVPTDWGERARFTLLVNMGPKIEVPVGTRLHGTTCLLL